jgi:PAS domain S-box-containing protein
VKAELGRGGVDAPVRVPLRVLIVEDSEDDALLLLRELRRGGYEPIYERVDTPEAMRRALEERGPWEVVLSDWQMPRFSGTRALEMSREANSDAPFIIVSGKVGEEAAVEAMRAGAHDYVMKGNLTRLCATVERGLEEAEVRRERERAEKSLKESEERYRRLVELSPDAIIVHCGGEVLFVNIAGAELFGVASPEELIGKPVMDFIHPDYWEIARARIVRTQEKGERTDLIQEKFLRFDGQAVDVEAVSTPIIYRGEVASLVIARDITERKWAGEALVQSEERYRAVVEQAADEILLEVRDDGGGFDPESSFPGHLGLKSMRERVARLGGTLRIESAPGEGTRIRAQIPPGT